MCTGQGGVRGPSPQQVKSTVKFRQPPQRTLVVEGVRVVEVKANHPLLKKPANERNDGENAAYLNHFLDGDHHDGSRDVLPMIVLRKPYRYGHRYAHDAHDDDVQRYSNDGAAHRLRNHDMTDWGRGNASATKPTAGPRS